MKRAVAAGLLAALVVAAGCVDGVGPGTVSEPADTDGDGSSSGADGSNADGAASDDGGTVAGDSGTVNFYISDRPNDMGDFEHLNVTVTTVRFHLVDPADSGTDATATATMTTDDADATATETTETEATDEPEAEESERESGDAGERGDEGDGEDGRWIAREVKTTTVDLTELQGANATLVDAFDLPAGEYDQVRLEVSETNGTLTDGSSTRVKLPSERLKLTKQFTVGNGDEVNFVFDVTVHEAGKSGKYILKPVVGESGTDVPIDRVGEKGDDGDDGRADDRLQVQFVGSVAPGENVTVRVTQQGDAVANATVSVDDVTEGTTSADGEFAFEVPADAEAVEVEVTAGETEGELEREFGDGDSGSDEANDGSEEAADDERGGNGQGNG